MRKYITSILLLTPTLTFGQGLKQIDFSLIVASCFQGDTIKIVLNGLELITNDIVTSDFVTGTTGIGIYQDKDGLWISKGTTKIKRDRLPITKQVTIDFFVNKFKTTKTIELRKGKIIIIDNCYVKSADVQTRKTLKVRQFKKMVTFD